jgi:hypothetical protein
MGRKRKTVNINIRLSEQLQADLAECERLTEGGLSRTKLLEKALHHYKETVLEPLYRQLNPHSTNEAA